MKRGLGDTVASWTKKLGISECGGCSRRRDILNRWFPYLGQEGRMGKMAVAIGDHTRRRRRSFVTDQVAIGESVAATLVEAPSVDCPGGTQIFSDGFEGGNLSQWTAASPANTATNGAAFSGTWGLEYDTLQSTNGDMFKQITPTTTLYAKWRWRFVDFNWTVGGGSHFWRLNDQPSSSSQIDSQTCGTGCLEVITFYGLDQFIGPDVTGIPTSGWFIFEFFIDLGTPNVADGQFKLKVNGLTKVDVTMKLRANSAVIRRFLLNTNYSLEDTIWNFDDVVLCTSPPPGF